VPSGKVMSLFVFLLVFSPLSLTAAPGTSLSPTDIAKIRQVHKRYEEAWLKGYAEGVRSLFTDDCVLLPHHGDPPLVGKKQMNEFWFPPNGPATTVTKLVLAIESIGGDGQIAYVWGTDEVAWTTTQNGKTTSSSEKGTFLAVLQKQPDGEWKISHRMWDDPAPQP
jgi:uncharacterized protein (TIGR02246 family)